MKFDAIISNPPYQSGNQSIYQNFINFIIDMDCDYNVMITKNNWLKGNTLKPIRIRMINYGLKNIVNYSVPKEIFNDVHVAVSIFELTRGCKETQYKEIRDNELIIEATLRKLDGSDIIVKSNGNEIVNKVLNHKDFESYHLCKNARLFSISSDGKFMYSNYTEELYEYNLKCEGDFDTEVIFLASDKTTYSKFIKSSEMIKGKEYIDKYKVVCGSKALNTSAVTPTNLIIEPGQVMTNSFNIVGVADTEQEAIILRKYLLTKFHRYMIKQSLNNSRTAYGLGTCVYVPMQDFTEQSDIDWSLSIEEINKQLYKKYNLSEEEVNIIENEISILS